jgi:hypothetical protein
VGGPPAWEMVGGANDSPNIKLEVCYETLHTASEKVRLFGTT